MRRIKVLDCTLRDGGYCNEWGFGEKNIRTILNGLSSAGIDYVECGFLSKHAKIDNGSTMFSNLGQISRLIPQKKADKLYLIMINYGEYSIEQVPEKKDTAIDGIRVAFHKKDWVAAMEFCSQISAKGYLVFVQPMVSMSYSEKELVCLIKSVNKIKAYAFYLVDSFGMMRCKEILHYVRIANNELSDNIELGLHAHNNLQLAFSNAQEFAELQLQRKIIVDVTMCGMGRGAGNLNAELFLSYLNESIYESYSIKPLLYLMDEIISPFFNKNPWGYSLSNYLSALHMIHPGYVYYLERKKEITAKMLDEVFSMMDSRKKMEYDEQYIEWLYAEYLQNMKTAD